jgi:hypothetical protein
VKARVLGIAAVLVVGTTYSTYRLWKARKHIKESFSNNLLDDYKTALEKLTYEERRAYRYITGFFERTWKTNLRGISCKATLGQDLLFNQLSQNKQYTFIDSIESEFDIELPPIAELERLTIRELMMLCVHESEDEHVGF